MEPQRHRVLPRCMRGSHAGEFQRERERDIISSQILGGSFENNDEVFRKGSFKQTYFHPFLQIYLTEKSLCLLMCFRQKKIPQSSLSFSGYSVICKYYLSVNTAFEADKVPRAGVFCFQSRYAGIHMVLLHVWLLWGSLWNLLWPLKVKTLLTLNTYDTLLKWKFAQGHGSNMLIFQFFLPLTLKMIISVTSNFWGVSGWNTCKMYFGEKLQNKLSGLLSCFEFWFTVSVSYTSSAYLLTFL